MKSFAEALKPLVIGLQNRNPEFEDMIRANALTLEKVMEKNHSVDWFKSLARIIQARRYQQEVYAAFDVAAEILVPSVGKE